MGSRKGSDVSKTLHDNSDSDDCILKNFRNKFPFKCETCSVGFQNLKAYEQHMNGKRHNKVVNTLKAKSQVVQLNAGKDCSNSASDEDEPEEEIECDVCQIQFSGVIPYYNHMRSQKHKKKLLKIKLKDRMKDMPGVLKNNEDDSNDNDALLPKELARCEPCEKVFYCPESYHQHMRSTVHKKKTQQKTLADTITSQNDNGENGENTYRCEICDKNFSGPIPYSVHMVSPIHEKEVKRSKAAAEIKHLCKETDDKHFFMCKECDKKFTHPLELKAHVNSNDHQKQEARKKLKQFLSQYPEIMLVKAVENAESDEEADDMCILICKVCGVSLSGPENAKQHVESNKHKSLKKRKKAIKQLKQEKSQQNGIDDEKTPPEDTHQGNGSKNVSPTQESTNKKLPSSSTKNQEAASENDDGFEMI